MAGPVRIDLDIAQINNMLRGPNEIVAQYLHKKAREVQAVARVLAPKDTGALAASIYIRRLQRDRPVVRVGTRRYYATWVHEGTGIYGPSGSPIRAKRGKVLVFSAGGKDVFAKYTRGQRSQPFLRQALRAVI